MTKTQKDDVAPERVIPTEPQVPGQLPKAVPESDPIGINAEGGITTNENGDPPGSPLEVAEREGDAVKEEDIE